jgi:hypothetical protein
MVIGGGIITPLDIGIDLHITAGMQVFIGDPVFTFD